MLRRFLMVSVVGLLALAAGHGVIHAASCMPSRQGVCHACKNCKYCGNCAKNGGTCSVCK